MKSSNLKDLKKTMVIVINPINPKNKFAKKENIWPKNIIANKIIIEDSRMAMILNCLSFIQCLIQYSEKSLWTSEFVNKSLTSDFSLFNLDRIISYIHYETLR